MAAQNDRILGFIEYLPEQNHLDCLFTDPAHQRQGVASALLSAVLPQADADKTVTADVSAAALPFFKKQGFILQHQNQIQRNGLVLINYRMILQTNSIDAAAQTNFSAISASPPPNPLPQEREQSAAASTLSDAPKAQRLPENSLCYADGQPILLGDRVTIDSKQWHGKIVALIAEQQCDPSIGSAEEWATLQSGVMAQFDEAGLVHYPDSETADELILLARADAADVLKSNKHNVECVAQATHADSKDTGNHVREPSSHTLQNVSDDPKPKKPPPTTLSPSVTKP